MTTTLLWWLITVQIAMGAFDTFYHHELTERLAWRPSQRTELRLHAVRNLLYGVLFLVLGFAEPRGWLAVVVTAILLVEVGITLADFVEEDLSRRLPATERINHTLLALNYGGILVLLLPILWRLSGEPTALSLVWHGAWSLLALGAACGVALLGLRDWHAATRSERLTPAPARGLAAALPPARRILITGATGFVGSRLVDALVADGHTVSIVTRERAHAAHLPAPITVLTTFDQIADEAAFDAVVNIAGAPIADAPWTGRKRRRMLRSRLRTTRALVRLLARLDRPPGILVSGSAIGWYGLRGDEALTEADGTEPCFSHRLCAAWEREAMRAEALGIRVVTLRTGLVLGIEGGLLARMLTPFEFGLGGPIGAGRQWMSWIARDDLVRVIVHAIATPALEGPLNATAPHLVRNADFARALGRALHRPAILPAPAWLLRRLGGDFAEELLLGGQRIVPDKAIVSGFAFRFPTLDEALAAMLGGQEEAARASRMSEAQPARSALGLSAPQIFSRL